jgi:hypothetical protein
MPIAFSPDFGPSHRPLMTDAACRSLRGDLTRALGRTGILFGTVGGAVSPRPAPRARAGTPAELRVVRRRLLDDAGRLRAEDGGDARRLSF